MTPRAPTSHHFVFGANFLNAPTGPFCEPRPRRSSEMKIGAHTNKTHNK